MADIYFFGFGLIRRRKRVIEVSKSSIWKLKNRARRMGGGDEDNKPLPKKQLFVQSHSVNLRTKNRVPFFAENWNLKVEAKCPKITLHSLPPPPLCLNDLMDKYVRFPFLFFYTPPPPHTKEDLLLAS